jgi:hypothetical protein
MGKNDYSLFIRELTEDPAERTVLKALLIGIKSKYKVKMTAEKLPRHSRDAVRMTADFLQRPSLIKSFNIIVMKKLRYQSPQDYAHWIEDLTNNYDYALGLRLRFKPTQTYKALGDYMAGLSHYAGGYMANELTADQKSCLIALSYVTSDSDAFIYEWDAHFVRLTDSEMVEYICDHPEKAAAFRELITERSLVRPAELEAALAGSTSPMLNGSL